MRENVWRPSTKKLFNKVLACSSTYGNSPHVETELASASKLGEIYEYSPSLVGCVVRNLNAAKSILKLIKSTSKTDNLKGSELMVQVPVEQLDEVVKILKIKKSRPAMAKILNDPFVKPI